MFGWRQSIVIESIVEGEGGARFGYATNNFELGCLLDLFCRDFSMAPLGPDTPYAGGPGFEIR